MKRLGKFARLFVAFAGSVWGMRLCSPWLKSGVPTVFASGLLLLTVLSVALAMVVNEEVKRDTLEMEENPASNPNNNVLQ
ncbi:MAG TPA: hypothetical protein VFA76_17815 [Terriglobales bacterium]|nr:hypothetical protein [Terriglobales bacterium]